MPVSMLNEPGMDQDRVSIELGRELFMSEGPSRIRGWLTKPGCETTRKVIGPQHPATTASHATTPYLEMMDCLTTFILTLQVSQ